MSPASCTIVGRADEEQERLPAAKRRWLLFASHAAVAYAQAQKVENMGRAIATRDLIGQAKGILTERYAITGLQAFNVLARYSQTENRKLRDIALDVVSLREAEADRRRDA